LYFTLKAEQKAFTADKPVRINSRGLRGPEIPFSRRQGSVRLLLLGDSIVFGYGVADGEDLGSRLVAQLKPTNVSAEVVNTGVPSYNSEQEVAFLERDGLRYHPDWVVVGVCWNDINEKSGVIVNPEGWLVEEGAVPSVKPSGWSESEACYP